MSSETSTHTRRALGLVLAAVVAVIAIGLVLREYGPGNMGVGVLQGGAAGLLGWVVLSWRVRRRPQAASSFERAWSQTGDERDDTVLTRALAVLGLLAFPLTGATTIAIALGAAADMMLTILLVAQVCVGAIAFAVIDHRN